MKLYAGECLYIKTKEGKIQRLYVEYDSQPENPREFDEPVCNMACWHSRYNIGDKEHEYDGDEEDFFRHLCEEHLFDEVKEKLVNMRMDGVQIIAPTAEMPNKKAVEDYLNPLCEKYQTVIECAAKVELPEVAKDVANRFTYYKNKAWDEYNAKYKLATEYKVIMDGCKDALYKGSKENCEEYIKDLREDLLDGEIYYGVWGMYSQIVEELNKAGVAIEFVSLYDHSGLSISLGASSGWDCGVVGWIYVTKEKLMEERMHKKEDGKYEKVTEENWMETAKRCMESEIETYDQYLRGEVYGFVIDQCDYIPELEEEEQNWEGVDSCWGFYGNDIETNGIIYHVGDEWLDGKDSIEKLMESED